MGGSRSFQHSRGQEHVRNLVYSERRTKMQYKYSKCRLYTTGITCDTGMTCDTRTDDVRDTLTVCHTSKKMARGGGGEVNMIRLTKNDFTCSREC
jgi:hypothetical protein